MAHIEESELIKDLSHFLLAETNLTLFETVKIN